MSETNRDRLRRAIDNMEKTETCLEIFDRTFDQAREALKVALIGLERVRPQTKGVLVVQDVEAGIQEAKAAITAMEGQP